MNNLHLRRMAVILVVFGLMVLLDQAGDFQWMKRNPLLFGAGAALLGLALSRRLENFSKKNANKA